MTSDEVKRARPAQTLLDAQRDAKAEWRREMARRPFQEKVRMVLALQRRLFPILSRRRPVRPWERPWELEP